MDTTDESDHFEDAARDASRWQRTAYEFVVAANYLLDWHDLRDGPTDVHISSQGRAVPMLVLFAIAVENLLKGLLVAQGTSLVSDGKLKREFKHHWLADYAKLAKLSLTDSQHELLLRLRDVVEGGRYPIATTATGSPGARQLDYPEDVQCVWSVLELVDDAIRSTGTPCLPRRDLTTRYRPPGYDLEEGD